MIKLSITTERGVVPVYEFLWPRGALAYAAYRGHNYPIVARKFRAHYSFWFWILSGEMYQVVVIQSKMRHEALGY